MRNKTAAKRRLSTPLAITALLALAAILSLMGAVPATIPAAVPAQTVVDYDTDDDGYIEVNSLAKLRAIRFDLNGDGAVSATDSSAYGNAFPNRDNNAATRMGCPSGTCVGYELTANLTFDENGDGQMTAAGDPTYWNSGAGWNPIAAPSGSYSGDFNGNGHTIDYLTIDRQTNNNIGHGVGLFRSISSTSRVESVGITNANVNGYSYAGALTGYNNSGTVVACYSTGSVSINTGGDGSAGGLVGWLGPSTGSPSIASSYSTASVSGHQHVGGLVGAKEAGTITHSYATGAVTRISGSTATNIGGLIGSNTGTVTASYYDSTTSGCVSGSTTGCTTSAAGTAQTTSNLQSPTTYTGIYAAWNANLDGVDGNDDPWDFGGASAYPTLIYHNTDYDSDEDGYIEVGSLAQLDAIRHDLTGAGSSTHANYIAAFPNRVTSSTKRMGCPSGSCTGYELTANLTFDENGDGQMTSAGDPTYWNSGAGWNRIGDDQATANRYSGDFKGNGYTIDYLYINRATGASAITDDVGLFGSIHTTSRIETLGVTNANVTATQYIGILVGSSFGEVVACFTTGEITGTGTNAGSIGGLVGYQGGGASFIESSYSTASVSGPRIAGGLLGYRFNGNVKNSYSTGMVMHTASAEGNSVGGLVGWFNTGTAATGSSTTNSYWDTTTSGQTASPGGGTGKTTAELRTPTDYTGIYADWNADIDSVSGNDDPWDFVSPGQYPHLKYGGHTLVAQGCCDYDQNNDGYIEIHNLAQLNAIRYDRNSDGDPDSAGADTTAYNAAFPHRDAQAASRMGCPSGTCTGYELIASLDFDENGDGQITQAGDPTYWRNNLGWEPIGPTSGTVYTGNFRGNGHTINNLYINRQWNTRGLFGRTNGSRIETVGVTNANITGHSFCGILVGSQVGGAIIASYTTGKVSCSANPNTGGLVGRMTTSAQIKSSYSTAFVESTNNRVGGLVGAMESSSTIADSYSTGRVSGASTSTGIGGLVGHRASGAGAVTNSYWDTVSSGQSTSAGGAGVVGKTPRELQTVTDYSGIYANWNANLDGNAGNDDPWDFGNGMQYPMLKYDGMSTDPQGGQAMGVPDNWNAPVVGERVGVCLMDGPGDRATVTVSGTDYRKPWTWEKSTNGDTWTAIPGTGDGSSLPSYEYSPVAADAGSYLRAKVELSDGSFAYTRALGGRVIAASGATAGADIPFRRGHAAPQVGAEIVVSNPLPDGATDVRAGWQRCPNNTAPHTDCEAVLAVPGVYWFRYTPTVSDVGNYLRMYVYYETADGTWTRQETPFTTGVVAAQ